jgi:hypothetical protein
MSQYIPGIVQYVPQVQPYRPDLNFYQKVLETKQAQYKAGYDQLSSLYGNLLESPMLRSENVDLRNKFFNQIGAEIAKVSSMDLSLPQNVEAASKIFQPLIDNKYILKDMAYTKQAYGQLRQADNFRNCTNEKECGGKYWEGGVRAIQYQMQDFAKSSAEESLGFTAPRYTPAVNIAEKAMKFAKDMGFNMQTVSWTPDGRYQVTTKNGTQMIPSLTNAFISTFQNDQAAVDYYNTKSYLSRKDFIASSVDQYGSEEAAENYYLDQMAKDLYVTNDNLKKSSQKDVELAKRNQSVSGQVIKDRGIDPDDPDDQKLVVSHNQSLVDEMIAASAADHYEQTAEVVNPETVTIVDAQAKRRRVDAAVANGLFQGDLMNAARSYAELTMEQEVKADPYAVANHEHALALDKMQKQFGYDVELEQLKTSNKLLLKGFDEDSNPLGQSSNSSANEYSPDPTGLGGTAEDPNLKGTDDKAFVGVSDAMTSSLKNYMTSVNAELNQIANAKPGDLYGKVTVTDDMIKWARDKQKEIFNGQKKTVTTTTPIEKKEPSAGPGLFAAALSAIPGIGPIISAAAGQVVGIMGKNAPTEVVQEKNVGGLLDANFNVKASDVDSSFSDPNSQNNWFKVNQRLNNFLENDPMGKILIGQKVNGVKEQSDHDQKLYFANLEKMRHNVNGVQSALSSNRGNISKNMINPEYARVALDNFAKDANIKTKEQFVKEYVENAPKASRYNARFGISTPYDKDDFADEAEELYDQYSAMFNSVYNNSSDKPATVQFADYKPLIAGYRKNASGAGIEASPLTVRGVDSAYRGDLGARDFVDIYRNVEAAISQGKNVQVYGVDGSKVGENLMEKGSQFSDSIYKNALDMVYSHIQSGRTKKDKDRARFDMTIHPIIGNDDGKVGFTIKLDQEFIEKNKGSKDKGVTGGIGDGTITVVMDKEDVNADAYRRLNKGLYTTLMEAYGEVNLNGYPNGGNISIKPSQTGQGYDVAGNFKVLDPETGEFRDMIYNETSNPYSTPDLIASQIMPVLKHMDAENYAAKEALRQTKNLIKDPAQLVQQ